MNADSDELNPYRSPQAACSAAIPVCQVDCDPTVPLKVALIASSPLRRHVQLSGRFSADIDWNANGFREFVAVNGQKIVVQPAVAHSIPLFQFQMVSGLTTHLVKVETRVRWVYVTTAFRISIDGRTVYSEGDCSRLALP